MSWKGSLLFASLFLLAGCGRVATTTKLAADGSYSRTSAYTVVKGAIGNGNSQVTFHSLFTLPDPAKGGPKWTTTEDKDERHLTLTNTGVAGGDSVGDLGIIGGDGKQILKSRGTVTKLPDGNLEYDETLEWVGPVKPIEPSSVQQLVSAIKPGIPQKFWQDDKLTALGQKLEVQLIVRLMGPPSPSFVTMFTNSDLGKMLVSDELFDVYSADLKETFPGITDAEVKSAAVSLETLEPSKFKELDVKSNSQNSESVAEMASLLFVLECPGKIVSTNGIASRTGKVYWTLYAVSAEYSKLVLKAVVDPRG